MRNPNYILQDAIVGCKSEVKECLKLLTESDEIFEVRIPKAGAEGTISGYFNADSIDQAVAEIEPYDGNIPAIYVTLNPVSASCPQLKGKLNSSLTTNVGTTTTDNDIKHRCWLLIDCDPERSSNTPSTEAEHQAALDKAVEIRTYLTEQGWPSPLYADSGNGAHLLYRVDLANDDKAKELFKDILHRLAEKFDDADVKIDKTVSNASRICKLYGTMSCKGTSTTERPHRRSKLLEIPEPIERVTQAQLTALSATLSPSPAAAKPSRAAVKPPVAVKSEGSIDIEMLRPYLYKIDPDLPEPKWVEVLYTVLSLGGNSEDSIELLRVWSSTSQQGKYDEQVFDDKVSRFQTDKAADYSLGTLQYLAGDYSALSYRKAELPAVDNDHDLSDKVTSKAKELLNMYGEQLNADHEKAIHDICQGMVHAVINEHDTFRIAYPLPTGFGKTTCIKALILELQATKYSLLICAERIEQLHELYQELVTVQGLPEARIGIYHSGGEKYAKIPTISNEQLVDTQFLLVAHNRMKSLQTDHAQYLNYQERKRNLVIWDESLLTSKGFSLSLETVQQALSFWLDAYQTRIRDGRITQYQSECEKFKVFVEASKTNLDQAQIRADEEPFDLPATGLSITSCKQVICYLDSPQELEMFCDYAERQQVRLLKTNNGSTCVQFIVQIPDDMDQIIILDASAPIKMLMTMDNSISLWESNIIKDHSMVTLYRADVRASRTYFKENNEAITDYIDEIIHLLENIIPPTEKLLVYTLKDRDGIQIETALCTGLAKYSERVKIVTWGNHKATNQHKTIKYAVTVGTVYRGTDDLAASILAQNRNYSYPTNQVELQAIQHSEITDLLYQGISRGNCRQIKNGQAGEMTVWVFLPSKDWKVFESLKTIMPGVKLEEYLPKHLKKPTRKDAEKYQELGESIIEYLNSLGASINKISMVKIRNKVAPELKSNSPTWRKARDYAVSNCTGWKKDRLSFSRIPI